jgi:hypothetical protein
MCLQIADKKEVCVNDRNPFLNFRGLGADSEYCPAPRLRSCSVLFCYVGVGLLYFDVISSCTLLSDIYPTKNIYMKFQKTEPGRHKILGRRLF